MGKYVKCVDDKGNAFNVLELNKIYQVIDEDIIYYELKDNATFWNKSRFEEIPNPQNLVKSSVSEPQKSNKLELSLGEGDKPTPFFSGYFPNFYFKTGDKETPEMEAYDSYINNRVDALVKDYEAKQERSKYCENRVKELEEENSELKAKNNRLQQYIGKILTISSDAVWKET